MNNVVIDNNLVHAAVIASDQVYGHTENGFNLQWIESSQKRYDKGAADILELLSTQSALADAQQERVRCLSDWRSARLRLMSSAGVLGQYGLE
jgi:hypothetical protein